MTIRLEPEDLFVLGLVRYPEGSPSRRPWFLARTHLSNPYPIRQKCSKNLYKKTSMAERISKSAVADMLRPILRLRTRNGRGYSENKAQSTVMVMTVACGRLTGAGQRGPANWPCH
jgi:hypothetical protein